MSTVAESVYPTRRRPPAGDLVIDPQWRSVSVDQLLLGATLVALDATDRALDAGLPAIRARGIGPDEDPDPSKYDSDPAQEEYEDVDPYP